MDKDTQNGTQVTAKNNADGGQAVKGKWRKPLNIALSCVCLAIAAFLVFVLLWIAIDKLVNKSPVPSLFGYSFLTVQTGSMAGTIDEGDLIIISKTKDYRVGDIICFLPDGDKIPTTHRIIRINDGNYFTKGDANNAADPNPVKVENILGEVTSVVPHVGLFFGWVANDFGWIYIVGIVLIVVIGVVLIKKIPAGESRE